MQLSLFLLSAAALVNAATAIDTVKLKNAADYIILTKTGITTVPTSSITGKIGVSPIAATAITGFSLTMDGGNQYSTSTQVTGVVHAASYGGAVETRLTAAIGDMGAAYTSAAGRDNTETLYVIDSNGEPVIDSDDCDDSDTDSDDCKTEVTHGEIGGQTLTTGVYTFDGSVTVSTEITFSGSDSDIFIVQIAGDLLLTGSSRVTLSAAEDGETAPKVENIFWQVAGNVEVSNSAVMKGTILVKNKAVFETSSTMIGRVLAQTACTLDKVTVTAE
jgi:hypothetical protein